MLLFSVLTIPLIISGPILLGTVEGYVFYPNGSLMSGASVVVEAQNCDAYCNESDVSDSGGYYLVGNLNLDAFQTVYVEAQSGTYYATEFGIADAYQAAYVNLTLARVPSQPTLVNPPGDNHSGAYFEFDWISGVDSDGLSTYDVFTFNGVDYVNVSPLQNMTNLGFATYNWQVITCNSNYCSTPASSSFTVYNNLPNQPILDAVADSTSSARRFNWTSSTDPDGDPVHYNIKIDGTTYYEVTSPYEYTEFGMGAHSAGVQVCDPFACTGFDTETFNVYNTAPPVPVLTEQPDSDDATRTYQWTTVAVDADGDSVHYQFYISNESDFSNIIYQDLDAGSSIVYGPLDYFSMYFWRVRACDNKSSCVYSDTNSFYVYDCNGTSGGQIGRGGSCNRRSCDNVWAVDEWTSCRFGVQFRNVWDMNNCVTSERPKSWQFCWSGEEAYGENSLLPQQEEIESELQEPKVPIYQEGYNYTSSKEYTILADFDEWNIESKFLGKDEVALFVLNKIKGEAEIVSVVEGMVVIRVQYGDNQIYVESELWEETPIDMDGDGEVDMIVRPSRENILDQILKMLNMKEYGQDDIKTRFAVKEGVFAAMKDISKRFTIPVGILIVMVGGLSVFLVRRFWK